jgi:hypothetical protein
MKLPKLPYTDSSGEYYEEHMTKYGIACAKAALIEAGKVGYRIGLEMQQKYQHAMSNNQIDPFIHDDMRDAVLRIEVKP